MFNTTIQAEEGAAHWLFYYFCVINNRSASLGCCCLWYSTAKLPQPHSLSASFLSSYHPIPLSPTFRRGKSPASNSSDFHRSYTSPQKGIPITSHLFEWSTTYLSYTKQFFIQPPELHLLEVRGRRRGTTPSPEGTAGFAKHHWAHNQHDSQMHFYPSGSVNSFYNNSSLEVTIW